MGPYHHRNPLPIHVPPSHSPLAHRHHNPLPIHVPPFYSPLQYHHHNPLPLHLTSFHSPLAPHVVTTGEKPAVNRRLAGWLTVTVNRRLTAGFLPNAA